MRRVTVCGLVELINSQLLHHQFHRIVYQKLLYPLPMRFSQIIFMILAAENSAQEAQGCVQIFDQKVCWFNLLECVTVNSLPRNHDSEYRIGAIWEGRFIPRHGCQTCKASQQICSFLSSTQLLIWSVLSVDLLLITLQNMRITVSEHLDTNKIQFLVASVRS